MPQYSLSELIQLADILLCERNTVRRYSDGAKQVSDPQLKEKLQKCAAIHQNHCVILEKMFKEE